MNVKSIGVLFILFSISCHESFDSSLESSRYENPEKVFSENTLKGGSKCPVCHVKAKSETFKLLNISCNAVSNHLAHGDGEVGGAVPGMEGFIFGEQCELIEVYEECPCFTLQELVDSNWTSYSACDGDEMVGYLGRGSYIYQSIRDNRCGSSYTINGILSTTTPGQTDACLDIIRQAIAIRGVPMVNGACQALEDWMAYDLLNNL